jgi:hypothetical protein
MSDIEGYVCVRGSVGSSEGAANKSPEGSYVGSLKASVMKSMELGNRRNLAARHNSSNRSISSFRCVRGMRGCLVLCCAFCRACRLEKCEVVCGSGRFS